MWDVTAIQSTWVRVPFVALSCAAIGVFVVEGTRWTYREATFHQRSEGNIPPALFDAQLQELREIDNFIGKKDEVSLRETFDFPNIMHYNILFVKKDMVPQPASTELSSETSAYFVNGKGIISVKYANISQSPAGGVQVEWIRGKIGVINTSAKFQENLNKLAEFSESSTLPKEVTESLKSFKEAINKDIEILLDVFNDLFQRNQKNFIYNDDYSSPYHGIISNAYWSRFSNLQPEAKKVSSAIRLYLKIN